MDCSPRRSSEPQRNGRLGNWTDLEHGESPWKGTKALVTGLSLDSSPEEGEPTLVVTHGATVHGKIPS